MFIFLFFFFFQAEDGIRDYKVTGVQTCALPISGDTAVVGDPAFPIHVYAVAMAGANVIRVPLGNDQAFLDRIERTIDGLYPQPKLLILNYPHNPTAMTVEAPFWDRAINLCHRRGIMI